ncbi:hypothetical protein BDV18DRAFT_141080 [Aspergillus unguis]
MPPTFRSSRSGRQFNDGPNRTRTGQIDHDVFEGLPVRRWTRQVQTVSQEPKIESVESEIPGQPGKPSIPEHPMPRDSHLLTPTSRALLRAARSGCIYIRQASKDFDEDEKETTDPEEQQAQQQTLERTFSMRKWTTVPKHLEAPEVEFLAKRRPGLPSLYGATAGTVDGAAASVPMRKTRFKKVDPATGNILIYAAWVPEGHKIEGEITDDAQLTKESTQATVAPQAPAPGTVVEGVGVVNAQGVVVAEAGSAAVLTPPKRRPPPPKRKNKGLKGRRKKVMFAPGEGADASLVHGVGAGAGDGVNNTDPSRMSVDQTTQDEEDDEEGDESDEGEGEGYESGIEAKTPETPGLQPSTEPEPEPTPRPTKEQSPTPVPIKTEANTELHAPQPLQSSTDQGAPPSSENTPAAPIDETSSAVPSQPAGASAVVPAAEDIQMDDAMPAGDSVQQAPISAPESEPVTKILSPPQEAQQPPPDQRNVASEDTETPNIEQPNESTDVAMAEADDLVRESSQTKPESTDFPTADPQFSSLDPAPQSDSAPEQANKQQREDFDLLDNLEASLGGASKQTTENEPKEPTPEQKTEAPFNQEAASEPETSEPVQPSLETPADPKLETPLEDKQPARENIMAPSVEQLTPPGTQQLPKPETTEDAPAESAEEQASPATEQLSETVPKISTHPEPSEQEPETMQPAVEQPHATQEPDTALDQASLESPALQEYAAESTLPEPSTEEHVKAKLASPVTEQEDQQAIASEPTASSAAEPAKEPISEPSPEQPQVTTEEPPEELSVPQAEGAHAGAAQEQITSVDGPSTNGEQQSQ